MQEVSAPDPSHAVHAWMTAFNEHNAELICALYDPSAILWGTLSPTLIVTPAGIRTYFERSFQAAPDANVEIQETYARTFGDTAVNTGSFTLSLTAAGTLRVLPGRFSFVYRRVADIWLIVDHHSSLVPVVPPSQGTSASGA